MGDVKVCMPAGDQQPWVQPYDVFNQKGEAIPDGAIEDADLQNWRLSLKPALQELIQPLPAQFHCQLFIWDMTHKQFLFEQVKPELERTTPLTDLERRERASQVALSPTTKYVPQLFKNDLTPPLNLSDQEMLQETLQNVVLNDFRYDVLLKIHVAASEALLSLNYETPKLCGTGIGFEKEADKPALIMSIKDVSTGKNNAHLKPGATWIVAIDGKNIVKSSFEEIRNLLRGPKDSEVTLTVRPTGSNQETATVRLKRVLFAASLL